MSDHHTILQRVDHLARTLTDPQVKLLRLLYDWQREYYPGPRFLSGHEKRSMAILRRHKLVEGIRYLTDLGRYVYRELGWVGRGQ